MDDSRPPPTDAPRATAPQTQALWIGPCHDELELVYEFLARHCTIRRTPLPASRPTDWGAIRAEIDSSPAIERIVWSCPGRLDYPIDGIEFLQAEFPEIPAAVALGQWWDGAARTGLRDRPLLSIPWHRQWDGWLPWLGAINSHLLEVCPSPYAYMEARWPVTAAIDPAAAGDADDPSVEELPLSRPAGPASRVARSTPPHPAAPRRADLLQDRPDVHRGNGLIVCGPAEQAAGWSSSALSSGFLCRIAPPDRWIAAGDPGPVDWALIDDTACDGATALNASMCHLIGEIRAVFPTIALACATHFPRFDLWQDLSRCGVSAIFSKPATGAGLVYWLRHCRPRAFSSAALPRT